MRVIRSRKFDYSNPCLPSDEAVSMISSSSRNIEDHVVKLPELKFMNNSALPQIYPIAEA